MSVNIGINIQRSPNRINQQLREAGVIGKYPKLLLDFTDNYYLANGGSKTLANAVTHARAGNATMTDGYGPELVTNGGFDSDSDWTKTGDWTISGGVATSSGGTGYVYQTNASLEQGKVYLITYTVTSYTSGSVRSGIGNTLSEDAGVSRTSAGTFTDVVVRTAVNDAQDYMGIYGSSFVGSIDNVSVREMPVIKWAPHNQFPESEDVSGWSLTGLTPTINATTAPDGTTTADLLTITNGASSVLATNATDTGDVFAFWVKNNGADFLSVYFAGYSGRAWVDLSDFTAGSETGSVSIKGITDAGNDWYLIEFQKQDNSSRAPAITLTDADNSGTVTGDGAKGIYIWGAHLYRSDLGGMVDNPERGDSYVPTALRPFGSSLVINGAFDTGITGWSVPSGSSSTISYSSGVMSCYRGNEAIAETALSTPVIAGRAYEITYTVSNISSPSGYVYISFSGAATPNNTSFRGNKTHTAVFVAGANTSNFRINAGGAGGLTFDIDNISVRESTVRPDTARYLPRIGHHVYNGSAWVNEGVLAESEARTNLLGYSESFDTGNWSYAANITITADQAISPAGTETADKVVATSTSGLHYIGIASSISSGSGNEVFSFYVKPSGINNIQIILANQTGGYSQIFNLSEGTLGTTGSGNISQSIQDVGNGWYRCSMGYTSTKTNPYPTIRLLDDSFNSTFAGNDTDGILLWGGQLESGATPSSYIPSLGNTANTVTRAAETFTIPSANLPWPEPKTITGNVYSGTDPINITGAHTFTPTIADDGSTKVVRLKWTQTINTGTRTRMSFRNAANSAYILLKYYNGSGTFEEIIVTSTGLSWFQIETGIDVDISSITLEEIDPLSVSIGMEGRMTYADEGVYVSSSFFRWTKDSNDYIEMYVDTFGVNTGRLYLKTSASGTVDYSGGSASDFYDPDVLVPFNISSRIGSTFIQSAGQGNLALENTTPTALPDLSSTDLSLAYDYMGTISEFRVWDKDIGDAGIVEATNPSLEPSLSLTFEGTGTNSFVTNDWSQ